MLELADRHVWGACAVLRVGSSPTIRTKFVLGGNIMKEEFLLLLQSVQREGMDKLLTYIEKTDFF